MDGNAIILVDDDRDSAELMRRLLANAGLKGAFRTFHNAAGALAFLEQSRETPPAIIFVDLSLSDLHGFDVVARIRQQLANQSTYVVAMSASDHHADIQGAFSVGANAYVEKFPSGNELRTIIAAAQRPGPATAPLCLLRTKRGPSV